jgi:hypothetical protein
MVEVRNGKAEAGATAVRNGVAVLIGGRFYPICRGLPF